MITLRNLSLQRGTKLLLQNVNLTLPKGQKVGFVGPNGCGKSSLFALLQGRLIPESGEINLPISWVIAQIEQETPAVETLALDYVLEGDRELQQIEKALSTTEEGIAQAQLHARLQAIDGYSARARAAQLLHGLGFGPEKITLPVNTFSGGWRMRLNLARTLMSRSDLLLLDEPTNHLDLETVLWFEQWLQHYPGTLLLISHDRDFLDNVVDTIVHFHQHSLTSYTGNYAAFEQQWATQLAQQQAAFEQQQREIVHIQNFVNRFRAKATKAKQVQSRLKALDRMEKIALAHLNSPFNFTFPGPATQPHQLLQLDNVSVAYTEQPVLQKIRLQITSGLRLGLLGVNGAGKSTFIKLLAGLLKPAQGNIIYANDLTIGYFAQHQLEQLDGRQSPLQHVQALSPTVTEQEIRTFLGGFGFSGDWAFGPILNFSGGEKARLALALLVWQRPHLLLLDEPTNHLDLEMRHALTLALQDYPGALILVSHDRHLLRTTTDQFFLLDQGQLKEFQGDLEDYRQYLLEQRRAEASKIEGKPKRLENQQRRVLQNRLKKLERELDKLTLDKQTLDTALADPAIYANRERVQQHLHQQTLLIQQLQQIEENWLETTSLLESSAD